jgi:BolA protein
MMPAGRAEMIRERLAALAPARLEIVDESHKHAGHAGARSGGGHFKLTIVSNVFDGKGLLQRHRMVYDALGSAMQTDIHALTIKALTPEELST